MAKLPSIASRPRSAWAWPTKISSTPAKAISEAPIVRGPMVSPSSAAARNSAIKGAMNAKAIACANGTRAKPQKNSTAITVVSAPR